MLAFFEVISNSSIILSVILSFLLMIRFSRLSLVLKFIAIYIIVGASFDVVSAAFYEQKENNLLFLHLFTIFEFILLSKFFQSIFRFLNSKFNILYITIFGSIFLVANSLFVQTIDIYNSYSHSIVSAIIIAYCIHFFVLILEYSNSSKEFAIIKWFVICLFFLHSVSLIVILFGNLMMDVSRDLQSYVWTFRGIVILATKIVMTIFFARLLLLNSEKVNT